MIILALGYVLVVFVMFMTTLSIVKHNSLLSLIIALSMSIVVLATMFLLANIMAHFIVGVLMMWLRVV